MCTIGAIFSENGKLFAFKNRDLPVNKENPQPLIEESGNLKYIKFGVDKANKLPGVWAGVNEKGLSILGADGNGLIDYQGPEYGGGERTWEAYEYVLAECSTISEAYHYIIEFYTKNKIGGQGDIIIIADKKQAVALEYAMNLWSIQFNGNDPFIVRTNFFLNLPHLRPQPETNTLHLSSQKRYERALSLLSATTTKTDINDVKKLLCDAENGPGAFSLCREGGEGEYKTICSVIMEVSEEQNIAHYIINEKPSINKYKQITL
jgi:hypothetical protein